MVSFEWTECGSETQYSQVKHRDAYLDVVILGFPIIRIRYLEKYGKF
jgi:hypothetical protein